MIKVKIVSCEYLELEMWLLSRFTGIYMKCRKEGLYFYSFIILHRNVCIKPPTKINGPWGPWVAQLVKPPTRGFGSGHDLGVLGWSPTLAPHSAQRLLGILSLSLPLPDPSCMHMLSLTLSLNK